MVKADIATAEALGDAPAKSQLKSKNTSSKRPSSPLKSSTKQPASATDGKSSKPRPKSAGTARASATAPSCAKGGDSAGGRSKSRPQSARGVSGKAAPNAAAAATSASLAPESSSSVRVEYKRPSSAERKAAPKSTQATPACNPQSEQSSSSQMRVERTKPRASGPQVPSPIVTPQCAHANISVCAVILPCVWLYMQHTRMSRGHIISYYYRSTVCIANVTRLQRRPASAGGKPAVRIPTAPESSVSEFLEMANRVRLGGALLQTRAC